MQDLRIEKVEINSFGKLKNTVLTPGKGMNVLTAPNESGKSTLAAFLKFVFYGFTDGRKKELARIIGGTNITETTLKSAEEMLRS